MPDAIRSRGSRAAIAAATLAIAAAGVAVTGCAPTSPASPGVGPSAEAATVPPGLDPSHVLVRVDDAGGLPAFAAIEDPRVVTLYADGTLIVRLPAQTGSLVPTWATRLDAAGLDRAWTVATSGGLAVDRSLELPGLFDASTTVLMVDDGTRSTRLSIYGLGAEGVLDGAGATLPPDELGLRRNATSVLAGLRATAGLQPYTPPAILLFWAPFEAEATGAPPRVVPWTAPVDLAAAGVPIQTPIWRRCALLVGAEAAAVVAVARPLPIDIVVEQAGTRYVLAIRPILPDELGTIACG
jgi:hypothetical protein